MQGVYVVANESATIHLDYNKHVFTSTSADMNRPMRAPQLQDPNFMRVRIQVNSDNSGADRMYVIQHENATKGYDNGYDAKNILADGQANIYTHEQDGQMEISVTNKEVTTVPRNELIKKFYFEDSVTIKKNAFIFKDIEITDELGNKGMVNGLVTHNKFNEFIFNIDIGVNNLLAFNTTELNSPDFYGK